MTYSFNIHKEYVQHVEIESDLPRDEAYEAVLKAYREGRLVLDDEPEWISTEIWDADEGTCICETNQWG